MFTRLNSAARSIAACVLAAASAATAIPATAQAQQQPDARWQAWLGCWSPAGTLIRVIGKSAPSVVCVVPGTTRTAVEITVVSGGKILDRTTIDADGQPHPLVKEGCKGSQMAQWSASARRVYLKSDFSCGGGPATHGSGMYAMAGSGDWIDVQAIRVNANTQVHAIRYRDIVDPGTLPAEIETKLQGRTLSKMAATLGIAAKPAIADVVEASHEVDAPVVSTWLIESDKISVEKPPRLNARQLEQLADNGVPSSVIDVMLGLSYPDELAVNPVNYGQVSRQSADSAYMQYDGLAALPPLNPIVGFDRFGLPIYTADVSALSLMYGCPALNYGQLDLGWNGYPDLGCSRFGYSPYLGYGYGAYLGYGFNGTYPLYGGYYGGIPIVVPRGGIPGAPLPPHGRVVNGHGYSAGGGQGGTTATPRSGSSGSATSGSASSSPPPPPPRTAEHKP